MLCSWVYHVRRGKRRELQECHIRTKVDQSLNLYLDRAGRRNRFAGRNVVERLALPPLSAGTGLTDIKNTAGVSGIL